MSKLILASGSPRRKKLLSDYGFEITVVKPDFDENEITERDPDKLVTLLAAEKNRCVRPAYHGIPVLSADTVVAINGSILGKPQDRAQARDMLGLLSGNTHTVYTGVCISLDGRETVFCAATDVTFYPLTDRQIERYIDTGSPFDKAGGYGIQDDMGIGFVQSVHGELSNVIGLPMGSVINELRKLQGENNGF